jgi:hypothetical protein
MVNEEELFRLQQIARDLVFEPFEGRKSLETIQKTRSGLEKGITQIKEKTTQTGDWLKENKLTRLAKGKVSDLVKTMKEKQSSSGINDWFSKLDAATEGLQKFARGKYDDLGDKAHELATTYIEKGMELLLYEDLEQWMPVKAGKILNSSKITTLEEVRALPFADKLKLTEALYPYNSPLLSKYYQSFDTSINLSLGAVVASNLPGTGLLVSLINMGKTLVKMGNRLNIMSGIYGTQISDPDSLFRVCAQILQSLEDYENNEHHTPLNSLILDDLYQVDPDKNDNALGKLLEQVVKKEAYIAIPGIGMISLGKISLDDLKMDLVVQHLVENYFALYELETQYGKERVKAIIDDYAMIYQAFINVDYFKAMRATQEESKLEKSEQKWKVRLQLFAGIDLVLKNSSLDLDNFVQAIFSRIENLPEQEKEKIIHEEISCIMDGFIPQKTPSD